MDNLGSNEIFVNTCGDQSGLKMFVMEAITGMPVLFDSGAEVSVIASSHCGYGEAVQPSVSGRRLKGVTGQDIVSVGTCTVPLDLGFKRVLTHELIVVDLNLPYIILGLDFMKFHGIILDPRSEAVHLSGTTDDCIPLSLFGDIKGDEDEMDSRYVEQLFHSKGVNRITVGVAVKDSEAQAGEAKCFELLKQFPDLIKTPDYTEEVKHGFELDIELTDSSPIMQKPRKFSPDQCVTIDNHMQDLITRGAMTRGSSGYVAPVVLVPKKNGKTRVCIDYSRLNAQTLPLNYPIPLIRDLTYRLKRSHHWYSVLDLNEAYFSLPLSSRASKLAAIITYKGVFRPLRTQFGLRNAPARFCEMMAEMVRGLEDFIFFYLDDFIVFSETIEEHLRHVQQLLERMDNYGMHIQPEKCHFCERQVTFLGYQVSREGLLPVQDNVAAIQAVSSPTNLQELRRFLGMINYYHNFIPGVARLLAPLHELLKGSTRPKRRKLDWNGEHQLAFEQAKQALTNVTHLAFDDPSKRLILTTDGSGTHCGGVLEIPVQKGLETFNQPIAFFSKPFAPTTRTRSAFNRELTALYLAVKHFKHCLRGREVLVRTDHKALVNAVINGKGEHSLHEQRMINYITEYGPMMQHIPGKENPVADHLSRPCVNALTEVTDEWEIPAVYDFALYQNEDSNMPKELDEIQVKEDSLLLVTREVGEHTLYGVVDRESHNRKFRPIVPKLLQPMIFHKFHNTLHQGRAKSCDIIKQHYFWRGMRKDIETWVQYCPKCQSCKVSRHNKQTLENFPGNPQRLETIHMDLVGPLNPASDEYQFLLTIRDRNTGFSRLVPLLDKNSSSVVRAFKSSWVGIFGIPGTVVTDNGGEFVSGEFATTCESLGIRHVRTTSYHPQSNGFIERIHRVVKTALRCLEEKEEWIEHIPLISLMLNNQVADTNMYTPYQKTFGKVCRVPGVLLVKEDCEEDASPDDSAIQLFCEMMSQHYRSARPLDLHSGYVEKNLMRADHVRVRKEGVRPSLSAFYEGPYPVIRKFQKYFIIRSWEGERKISVDRLKTAYMTDEAVAEPGPETRTGTSEEVVAEDQESRSDGVRSQDAVIETDQESFSDSCWAATDYNPAVRRSGRETRAPERMDL